MIPIFTVEYLASFPAFLKHTEAREATSLLSSQCMGQVISSFAVQDDIPGEQFLAALHPLLPWGASEQILLQAALLSVQ